MDSKIIISYSLNKSQKECIKFDKILTHMFKY